MNFSPSPFWGGVLAVTFYQLVFTNPISFLSMGLGIVIGFGLSVYVISQLVVRGYIHIAEQCGEALRTAFRDHPMLISVVSNYMSSAFSVLNQRPTYMPSNSPVCCPVTNPGCPVTNPGCPINGSVYSPQTSPPHINMDDIMNICKSLDLSSLGVSVVGQPDVPTDLDVNIGDQTDAPVENQEDAPVDIDIKIDDQPDVPVENQEDVCEVAPDAVPESCRGVHGANPEDPVENVPVEETDKAVSPRPYPKASSIPRRKGARSQLATVDAPKPARSALLE